MYKLAEIISMVVQLFTSPLFVCVLLGLVSIPPLGYWFLLGQPSVIHM